MPYKSSKVSVRGELGTPLMVWAMRRRQQLWKAKCGLQGRRRRGQL